MYNIQELSIVCVVTLRNRLTYYIYAQGILYIHVYTCYIVKHLNDLRRETCGNSVKKHWQPIHRKKHHV